MSIASIKQSIDILEVFRQHYDGELRQRGRRWWALCPFHREKTASFCIEPEKGRARCFGCGWHGDALDLISHATGQPIKEVLRAIGGTNKVEFRPQKHRDFRHERDAGYGRLCEIYRETFRYEETVAGRQDDESLPQLADVYLVREMLGRLLSKLDSDDRESVTTALTEARRRGLLK